MSVWDVKVEEKEEKLDRELIDKLWFLYEKGQIFRQFRPRSVRFPKKTLTGLGLSLRKSKWLHKILSTLTTKDINIDTGELSLNEKGLWKY